MNLTDEQVDFIRNNVESQGLTIDTLKEDIVDHLCCVVEIEMKRGKDFHISFQQAIQELAPKGIQEIQNSTLFLLNSKKIIIMKKFKYISGFVGSFLVTAGLTMKLLHLPFAWELFVIGTLTLLLVFVPMIALDYFKVSIAHKIPVKTMVGLGILSAIFIGLSGVFSLFDLDGVFAMFLTGAALFACGFLPFLFYNLYKRATDV